MPHGAQDALAILRVRCTTLHLRDADAYGEAMRAILPTANDLNELSEHRDGASVSIYLESSPVPADHERVRLALRNAVHDAVRQLEKMGTDAGVIRQLCARFDELDGDRDFWEHQARGMALFASPDDLRAFRVFSRLTGLTAVGDRFDLGPLLRSVSFEYAGYVVAVTEGAARLISVAAETRAVEMPLDLPDDLHTVLEYASNEGNADRERARGAKGDSIEKQRYCAIVQDAVLAAIGNDRLPLILAASADFAPVYREVNRHARLLPKGIDANPASLDTGDLEARARALLDEHYKERLDQWREDFGTHRSNGKATTQLGEVARATAMGAVAELLFDMDDTREGSIDEAGVVTEADEVSGTTYGLVDEIAVRVIRTGGIVRAVRNEDLIDGSPVAAVLRHPLGPTSTD